MLEPGAADIAGPHHDEQADGDGENPPSAPRQRRLDPREHHQRHHQRQPRIDDRAADELVRRERVGDADDDQRQGGARVDARAAPDDENDDRRGQRRADENERSRHRSRTA